MKDLTEQTEDAKREYLTPKSETRWRLLAVTTILAMLATIMSTSSVGAIAGEPILSTAGAQSAADWDAVIAAELLLGNAFFESFEDLAVDTSLTGTTVFPGFTMNVSGGGVEQDVDPVEYGTDPRTGAQQATFQVNTASPTVIEITPACEAVGLGFYIGDFFDGGDTSEGESRVQIFGDGVLLADYQDFFRSGRTGTATNAVDGTVTAFGNQVYGPVNAWNPTTPVTGFVIEVFTGVGDNFVLDDIGVLCASPELTLTKDLTGVTYDADGTVTAQYTIVAENTGGTELSSIVITDDTATTLAPFHVSTTVASDTCTGAVIVEQLADGSVPVADTQCTVVLDVVLDNPTGTLENTASATAVDLFGTPTPTADSSQDGANGDPDGDGDPTNNSAPTPITFESALELDKTVGAVTNNGDGTFDISYSLEVSTPLETPTCLTANDCFTLPNQNVQVTDDIAAVFGAGALVSAVPSIVSGPCTPSSGYTGAAPTADLLSGTDLLLLGDSCVIDVAATVSIPPATLGTFVNTAGATSDQVTTPVEDDAEVIIPVAEDDSVLGVTVGTAVTLDVLGNDPSGADLDPTTVMITDPATGLPVTSLVVPGEGTWDVDPATGEITFTPEPGFVGDPTPIAYTVEDFNGTQTGANVVVDYLQSALPDESLDNPIGSAVTVDPLANDTGDFDPTTVMIIDPATGLPVTSLVVPGEGTWDVDPVTGEITFTPEPGFEGNPTIIDYTVDTIEGVTVGSTVEVAYAPEAAPDESLDNPAGTPVTVDPLANDSGDFDPTTVMIIDPATGLPVTSLVVPGEGTWDVDPVTGCLLYTSPSPRDQRGSRMPSSA